MKNFTKLIMLFSMVVLVLWGCGGTKPPTTTTQPANEETMGNIPDWFLNPPQDPNYVFGKGTATSRDMQLAIDKGSQSARMEISKSIEVRMNGLSKRFQEEVGTDADAQYLDMFTQASKEIVNQTLSGVSAEKQKILNEGGIFRAYVLSKLPIGASSQALLNKLKEQEQMYTRFRSSEVFEELERETEEYQEWKDEHGQP